MYKAHKWSSKMANKARVPNFGKEYVVRPALLKLLGKVKSKKVLELGCGSGYWLRLLVEKGSRCTGVDISANQLKAAKAIDAGGKIRCILADVTKVPNVIKTERYDIVLIEHVLLEMPTRKKLRKLFSTAYSLLKRGGMLVISDLHPFAPSGEAPNIETGKGFNYFSSGDVIKAVSRRIDGTKIFYKDYHWTLEDITDSITDAGFKITKIVEPRPSAKLAKRYPALAYRMKAPMSFMVRAVK